LEQHHAVIAGMDTATQEMEQSSDKEQSTCLLDLSAELRNRIYEHVLLDEEITIIDKDFRPPALLQVNRQVRSETHRMYYAQQKDGYEYDLEFNIVITNCDAALLKKAQRLQDEIDHFHHQIGRHDHVLNFDIRAGGRGDWPNLMAWCQGVQRAEIRYDCLFAESSNYNYMAVLRSALAVAKSHVGGSWERCSDALDELRPVLGVIDCAWECY
jgi:hypothetical protein